MEPHPAIGSNDPTRNVNLSQRARRQVWLALATAVCIIFVVAVVMMLSHPH